MPSGDRTDPRPSDVLRVALYAGVVFEHDAVSTSFLHKLRILTGLRDAGCPVEVVGFTHATDFDHPDIRLTTGLVDLMRSPAFAAADVHVFEYTMWYELLNALFLLERPTLVIDHNTTPVELVTDPEVQRACARARHERHNLVLATHVATDGEFTADELRAMGFPADRVSTLHLPAATAHTAHPDAGDRRRRGDPVRLLYVGRFVRAKGMLDLLSAMEQVWASGTTDVTLTVTGSIRFPDTEVLAVLEDACTTHQDDGRLTMHVDPTDDELAALYASADALVMPSHHEGFCVPVIEALSSGCYVIGADAGNIPYVMGGLGTLYPCGDVPALAGAITRYAEEVTSAERERRAPVVATTAGPLGPAVWRQRVQLHLAEYSADAYRAGFLDLLALVLAQAAPDGAPTWLVDAARSAAAAPTAGGGGAPDRSEGPVPVR